MAESVDPGAELRAAADVIATKLTSEASIADRPGQMQRLERLAGRVLELERLAGEEIARLQADNERLLEKAANAVADQATLKGLSVEDGAAVLELGPPRELVIAWVDAARKMLGDAENYSETRIDFPAASMDVKAAGEWERYVFTVQRAGKLTPHEARKRAETERDELRAAVDAVQEVIDSWPGDSELIAAMKRNIADALAGVQQTPEPAREARP